MVSQPFSVPNSGTIESLVGATEVLTCQAGSDAEHLSGYEEPDDGQVHTSGSENEVHFWYPLARGKGITEVGVDCAIAP